MRWVRESGMAILLCALVATVFVIPAFIPNGATRYLVSDVLMTLILVSGVAAVADHRRLAIVLATLSAFVVIVGWLELLVPTTKIPMLRNLSALGAFVVLAFAVGINVFASGRAIGDRVFGAVVLYLLLGLLWAVAYQVVETILPDSFTVRPADDSGLAEWVYFSFVTLTTVGYGDIAPVTQGARSLAMLEALVGQLYPAVIIARLVSLQTSSGS
jgi:hypothetical protein